MNGHGVGVVGHRDSFIPKLFLRLLWFFRRTAALFCQIRTFPQLFRFCSDLGNPDSSGLTRAWRTDRSCAATRRRTGLNHHSQYLRHWLPARDNQASGPGDKPLSSLQSLRYTSQECARRTTIHLHPYCALRNSLRALDNPDKAQHQWSPPKLRITIPYYTSYNTISPAYTPLPGVMTALALRTSLILVVEFHAVCRCTTSIESPKVKNPNPILHLIQHHLALLHASSRGNDRIGSSDLLDSGG